LDLGREALDLFRRLGETWGIVGALVVVAAARATLDQANTAVRLLAAEDVFAKTFGIALVIPHWQREFDLTLDTAREAVGDHDFDAAWSAGRVMSIDQAIDYALTGDEPQSSAEQDAAGLPAALAILTPREREVAALVAQGLSDHQVADALVISDRTAQTHLHHILYKLGLHSRADLIDWAPALGLVPDEA